MLGLSVVVAIGPAEGIHCLRYFLGAAPEYGTNEVLFLDIKDGAILRHGRRPAQRLGAQNQTENHTVVMRAHDQGAHDQGAHDQGAHDQGGRGAAKTKEGLRGRGGQGGDIRRILWRTTRTTWIDGTQDRKEEEEGEEEGRQEGRHSLLVALARADLHQEEEGKIVTVAGIMAVTVAVAMRAKEERVANGKANGKSGG